MLQKERCGTISEALMRRCQLIHFKNAWHLVSRPAVTTQSMITWMLTPLSEVIRNPFLSHVMLRGRSPLLIMHEIDTRSPCLRRGNWNGSILGGSEIIRRLQILFITTVTGIELVQDERDNISRWVFTHYANVDGAIHSLPYCVTSVTDVDAFVAVAIESIDR